MAKQTSEQKDAMERLRGNPTSPAQSRESVDLMRAADAAWKRLHASIVAAVEAVNPLLAMEVDQLIATHKASVYGVNINGWENPYPSYDCRSLLTQYQFISHHDQSENICDVWSRQTGKGFTVATVIGESSFKIRSNRWTITSPSERQSLLTLDKCKDTIMAFGLMVEGEDTERDGSHPQSLITSRKITLSNKSTVRGVPGMPSTLRGDTGNLVIDEGDHIENPVEFMRAVLGLLANEMTGKKQLRYITTPAGKNAPSYKFFHDDTGLWSKRRINIWQAVLMGIKQNPEKLQALLDDAEGWAQEFLCMWLDGSNILLPYELIQSCESIEASEFDTPEMLAASPLRKVAGIDFGRINDPTVMTTALRGLGMSIVRNITKLHGMSTPNQLDVLHPYIKLCDVVDVDYTGPGVGFGDLAVKEFGQYDPSNHQFGKIRLCNFTLPFKRLIFPLLRTAFEKRRILIPISSWLREDLHGMAQVIHNGQYNYKAPRSDEGHSDGCTALALMEHAAAEEISGCLPPHRFAAPGQEGFLESVSRNVQRRFRSLVG